MVRKRDIRQIEAIAREFGMEPDERREFGDYIEECNRRGDFGTGPMAISHTASCGKKLGSF